MLFLLIGILLNGPARSAGTLNLSLQPYAAGFSNAVDIVSAGDSRLFIVEQDGRIKIVQTGGNVLSVPFLNISGRVISPADGGGGEQGLLSLAFHPNYPANGYFYVLYTRDTAASADDGDVVISRFNVSADQNLADAASETILLVIDEPYKNHNGGALEFGPDGFLYISIGDGGSGGDPGDEAQRLDSLLGSILRIDVNNTSGLGAPDTCGLASGPYKIPNDNPFIDGKGGDCDEIWAWGLRNPFRFAFDSLGGGMFIGDVGQDSWEEVNYQPVGSSGGENYGWDCYEGSHLYADPSSSIPCAAPGNYAFPFYEYASVPPHCSVIGGEVYRGAFFPELYGYYVFTDYCSGVFWAAKYSGSAWAITELADLGGFFRSFGVDHQGEIYVVDGSKLYHVVEDTYVTPTPPPPTATPMDPDGVFGLNLVQVASGFSEPTALSAAEGSGLLITERNGKVWEINPSLPVSQTLVLDLSARVDASGYQEGLLGLVTDPAFESNGLVYLNYTDQFSNTVVARFGVTATLPLDPADLDVILTIPQPFSDNNGGGLAFGPDGFLYIALGDGGSVGDPNKVSQDPAGLLGKILRIDVHGAGALPDCGTGDYTIPAGNPFSDSGGCKEVWQLGFRNIWGLSFDGQNGDLWIADVGMAQVEEINRVPAGSPGGENFGWSCYEGTELGPNYDPGQCTGSYLFPFYEYGHADGHSVTGGYVYRGSAYPFMQGVYFFADFVYGKLWSLDIADQRVVEHYALLGSWSAFGRGNDGMIYVADYATGTIYRIEAYQIEKRYMPVIQR